MEVKTFEVQISLKVVGYTSAVPEHLSRTLHVGLCDTAVKWAKERCMSVGDISTRISEKDGSYWCSNYGDPE